MELVDFALNLLVFRESLAIIWVNMNSSDVSTNSFHEFFTQIFLSLSGGKRKQISYWSKSGLFFHDLPVGHEITKKFVKKIRRFRILRLVKLSDESIVWFVLVRNIGTISWTFSDLSFFAFLIGNEVNVICPCCDFFFKRDNKKKKDYF